MTKTDTNYVRQRKAMAMGLQPGNKGPSVAKPVGKAQSFAKGGSVTAFNKGGMARGKKC